MSVRTRRLAVGGILTATAIAVPVAALAAGSDSPPTKPVSSPAARQSAAAASKSAAAASQGHGAGSITGAAAVAALAGRLGVSHGAARHALQRISALSGPDGVDPASPAFVAIARSLGVRPVQLAAALDTVKQAIADR